MIIDKSLSPNSIGKAGELRVAFELLIRGFNPAIFYNDSGTDIILPNGKKIGIKTVSRPSYSKSAHSTRYYISFGHTRVKKVEGVWKRKYGFIDYSDKVDFWILWLAQDDMFYIIPYLESVEKMTIAIETPDDLRTNAKFKNYKSRSRYEKYKNNWEQLK